MIINPWPNLTNKKYPNGFEQRPYDHSLNYIQFIQSGHWFYIVGQLFSVG